MKFVMGVFLTLASLSSVTFAADADTNSSTPATKIQSSDDYYDGGNIDQPPQVEPGKRNPASGDLPYSDDEIQKNTPENYAPKNMPIDQD